jgi:hypothetical protein
MRERQFIDDVFFNDLNSDVFSFHEFRNLQLVLSTVEVSTIRNAMDRRAPK